MDNVYKKRTSSTFFYNIDILFLGTRNTSEEKPTETPQSQPPASQPPSTDETSDSIKKPSPSSISSSPSPPQTSTSQNRPPNSTQSNAPSKPLPAEPSSQAHVSPQPQITMPSPSLEQDTTVRKDEEPNMEHFAKAAENLVASLDDDDDDDEEVISCVLFVNVIRCKRYCNYCLNNVIRFLCRRSDLVKFPSSSPGRTWTYPTLVL